ncbi:acyl-CoA thioesterase [Metapseudomonas boanensis]|uniref:Acyl-CoA thioesterase n=1 Tax=Metapseudomonas boanensis TaxID=2822138 RepID=A0ABS5XNM8_9GAMM|nr:thioesterase family protein [Pseudomonas boanensis]MBT8769312.1 acyl-CoA thioesterase [Pseudomonas boanensis]
MNEATLTYRGAVYPWHCDHMGHMNVMWYVGKFDEATWQLFTHLGLAPSRLRNDSAGMAAVEQHIEYRRELHAGDVLSIRSRILEVTEKAIRFCHEMVNDETGEVAATTTLVGVHLDTQMRKSKPLPSEVRERVQAWQAPA